MFKAMQIQRFPWKASLALAISFVVHYLVYAYRFMWYLSYPDFVMLIEIYLAFMAIVVAEFIFAPTWWLMGSTAFGKSYLVLWPLEELVPFNREYEVATYVPGLFLIGSNGAGEGFGYDLRPSSKRSLVIVPFVGMDWKEALPVGSSMAEFLRVLYKGRLFE